MISFKKRCSKTSLTEILLDFKNDMEMDKYFDIKGGKWYAKDGWIVGENPENCPGMIVSKDDYFGNVLLSFVGQVIAPSTHDIDFMWKLWLGEKTTYLQIVGFVLLFVAFVLPLKGDIGRDKRRDIKGFIYGFLTFLSNGMISVTQKCQQNATPGKESGEFLMIGFTLGTVILLAWFLVLRYRGKQTLNIQQKRTFVPAALVGSIFSILGEVMLMQLIGKFPNVLLFPVTNGGIIVFSGIVSILVLKEKVNAIKLAGLLCGVVAIIMISI